MMASQVSAFGNNFSLQSMVTLLVAIIALSIAALSPVLLMKFAPVIPMAFGGTSGPAVSMGSQIGPSNMTDAGKRAGGVKEPTPSAPDSSGGSGAPDTPPAAGGHSLSDAANNRARSAPVASDDSEWYTLTGANTPDTVSTMGRVWGGTVTSGHDNSPTTSGRHSADFLDTDLSDSAGSGGARKGAEGAMAGAESRAGGAGAAIGVPTIIPAASMAAAKKSVSMAQSAGESAAGSMDDTPST